MVDCALDASPRSLLRGTAASRSQLVRSNPGPGAIPIQQVGPRRLRNPILPAPPFSESRSAHQRRFASEKQAVGDEDPAQFRAVPAAYRPDGGNSSQPAEPPSTVGPAVWH